MVPPIRVKSRTWRRVGGVKLPTNGAVDLDRVGPRRRHVCTDDGELYRAVGPGGLDVGLGRQVPNLETVRGRHLGQYLTERCPAGRQGDSGQIGLGLAEFESFTRRRCVSTDTGLDRHITVPEDPDPVEARGIKNPPIFGLKPLGLFVKRLAHGGC